MKEIKRYIIEEVFAVDIHICEQSKWCKSEDVDQLITDHKAVVETINQENKKLFYQNEDLKDEIDDYFANFETMQKRIDELEIGTLEMSHIIAVQGIKIKELESASEIKSKALKQLQIELGEQDCEIQQLESEKESLKCCGNCEHSRSMSELTPFSLHHATYCQPCKNNSNWQLKEG